MSVFSLLVELKIYIRNQRSKMKKKKFYQFIGAILMMCTAAFMIVTSSCSKSTEPTEIVFIALPNASEEYSFGYALGVSDDGTIAHGGSAVNTPDNVKYMEEAPVYWTNSEITLLPFPGTQIPDFARAASVHDISDTGVLVGNQGIADLNPLAYYYSNDQRHTIIDPATSIYAQTASGISGDGNLIVGLGSDTICYLCPPYFQRRHLCP